MHRLLPSAGPMQVFPPWLSLCTSPPNPPRNTVYPSIFSMDLTSHQLPAVLLRFYSRRAFFPQPAFALFWSCPSHPRLLLSVCPGSNRQHVTVGCFAMNFWWPVLVSLTKRNEKSERVRCQCCRTGANIRQWLLDKTWDGMDCILLLVGFHPNVAEFQPTGRKLTSLNKELFTHKICLSQQSLLHSFFKRLIYIFSQIYMWQEEHSRTKDPPAQQSWKTRGEENGRMKETSELKERTSSKQSREAVYNARKH